MSNCLYQLSSLCLIITSNNYYLIITTPYTMYRNLCLSQIIVCDYAHFAVSSEVSNIAHVLLILAMATAHSPWLHLQQAYRVGQKHTCLLWQ